MDRLDFMTNLFTILTIVAMAGVGVAVLLAVVGALSAPVRAIGARVVAAIGPEARRLACAVAAVATAGSLYYSEIEGFAPCRLCWYQRICMYPLVVILGVGAWKRDPFTRLTALPFVLAGLGVSTWHFLIERFPTLESNSCGLEVKCSAPYFTEFGFITLAVMCLSGMALIGTLLLVDRAHERASQEVPA
ncbi:MAG: disulfide bond formation protein B [Actinomycetes bacterium]